MDEGMDTPTNSILNRDAGDGALISRMVYENESLKIEVETLREKLDSTDLLRLDELRSENEDLKSEVEKLRVQLAEKTNQLDLYRSSDDRFSNINDSLAELLKLVQTQRLELAEMKDSTCEKDVRIEQLLGQLKQSEEALSQARAECDAATQNSAQITEREDLRVQLNQVNAELETLRQTSGKEVTELQNRLRESQEQLLSMKEDAAAKSRVRGERVSLQEQEIMSCREREASTQRQVIDLQAEMELLKKECSELREAKADLVREQQNRLEEQRSVAVAAESQRIDLNSKEVKLHVERAVNRATEAVERRLREQVEHNASLLSRMALIEKESEAILKTKGMSTQEISVVKERVDARSRHDNARTTMQRRVAEVLSKGELSKGDIEKLLQEMLDYQEDADQQYRTLLAIKDIELEEKERTLRRDLKRVMAENASLMKQLQELAVGGFQRERYSTTPTTGRGGSTGNPQAAEVGPSTALGVRAGGARSPAAPENSSHDYPYHRGSAPVVRPGKGLSPTYPAVAPQAKYRSASPQQLQPRHPQQHLMGNMWSDEVPRQNTAHADPNMRLGPNPQYSSPLQAASSVTVAGSGTDSNAKAVVRCPACTYEQRYGNVRCEICNATLQLP
ncbi:hypothetical protein JKF63_01726 [Porcisia hertigi]|uniref:Uncharacterized protein n=1 Tax=Porcisia hertigi TaxID=2761500 RepID=A0A836L0N0_9TRYP|nr:hypothetical protein JKF63_01726 [Porcisia hertigi]